jgi:hypothetical protein
MDVLQGAKEISKIIQEALNWGEGALIGRNGTIELECMIFDNMERFAILENNAGIFPCSNTSLVSKWCSESIQATEEADVLATGWYNPLKEIEQVALKEWKSEAIQVSLRSLEPYYVEPENQWTHFLFGQKVSVVSCFTNTASKQVTKIKDIWGPLGVLPEDVDWQWVQTGHPPSVANGSNEWPPHVQDSLEAIDYVVSEVIRQGSRFAIIGCGGIGMPIARRLMDRGVIAIVLGGAIQVLFGIKGSRWENHSVISKFWNEHWVWPSQEETPRKARKVEGGCYWQSKN